MADILNITRRDFLNGIALSVAAGTSVSPLEVFASGTAPSPYYPPALTGLRGNHAGSFEIGHAVAMAGAKFGRPAEQIDATYDLVVVGGRRHAGTHSADSVQSQASRWRVRHRLPILSFRDRPFAVGRRSFGGSLHGLPQPVPLQL